MGYFLRSARLGFREWREADLVLAQGLWRDPEVMRHLGGPWTDEAIFRRFRAEMASQTDENAAYWPVFTVNSTVADGEFAGCAGLRRWNGPGRWFELGVHLHRAFWKGGFGEEAARAVLGYAFGAFGVDGVVARHGNGNRASSMLIHRLGFERVEDTYWAVTDGWHPTYRMEAGSEAARGFVSSAERLDEV